MATKSKVTCFWIMLAVISIECILPSQSDGNSWEKPSEDGELPPGAQPFGENSNGEPIYIARVSIRGAVIPGYFIKSEGVARTTYEGNEEASEDYEIFVGSGEWVTSEHGDIQSIAEEAGTNAYGQALYIGRAQHEGSWIIGYVAPPYIFAKILVNGGELPSDPYEVLIPKN